MAKQMSGEALMAQWLRDLGGGSDQRGLQAVYANAGLGKIYAELQRVCEKRDGRSLGATSLFELYRRLDNVAKGDYGAPAPAPHWVSAGERLKKVLEDEAWAAGFNRIETERVEICKAIGFLLGNCTVTFDWIKEVSAIFVDAGKVALRTAQTPGGTAWDHVKGGVAKAGGSGSTTSFLYDRVMDMGVEAASALHKTAATAPAAPGSVSSEKIGKAATWDVNAPVIPGAGLRSIVPDAATPRRSPVSSNSWSLRDDIVSDPTIRQVVWRHLNAVWEALKSFFSKAFGQYKTNLAAYAAKYFDDIQVFLTTLTDLLIRQIASDESFIFTQSMKLKDQLVQAFDSVFTPLATRIRYRSVRFSRGVARNVARGVNFGQLFVGADSLYQIAQTLAVGGTSFLSTNLGAIVNSLASIVRNVFKLCLRYWEYMMMRTACDEARLYWNRPDDDWASPLPDDSRSTAEAFSEWFAVYARWVPSVAATVLRSRICGSNLAWVQFSTMVEIDAGEFTQGVAYLQSLAKQADAYAAQSGVKILAHESVKIYLETRRNMLQPDVKQKTWEKQADVLSTAARSFGAW